MTLKFVHDPTLSEPEPIYRQLIAHIDQRAAEAIGDPAKGWRAVLGRAGRLYDDERITILKSGLFDADLYLSTYKDVAAARADPLQHYIESGDEEGRWPNAFFDPVFYKKQFAVTGRWPFSALHHYAAKGEAAGLRPCSAFDRDRYIAGNVGLGPWLERPLAHFLWIGRYCGLSPMRGTRRSSDQMVTISKRQLPRPVSPMGLTRGVNVVGPLDRVGGVGVSARGYLEAVRKADFGPVGARVQRREFVAQSPSDTAADSAKFIADAAINLVHMGPDTLPLMLKDGGGSFLSNRYNIAVWYWELPTLRPEWLDAMDLFHEFWAPSPFVARSIRQLTAKPVRLAPPYLSHLSSYFPERPSEDAAPHFVYCFDANSVVERKNPGLLLDAFLAAFPAESAARLTFKVTYPNRQVAELERLYAAARKFANIEIVDHLLSDEELRRLIASATAYVSPHRSEGLGLTIIEAMAYGTPVIATPFGGIETFVTPDASWPLRFRLAEVGDGRHPYPKGFVWADPDMASLVQALREVAANPQAASDRAKIARDRVLDHFASATLVQTHRDALEKAAKRAGL